MVTTDQLSTLKINQILLVYNSPFRMSQSSEFEDKPNTREFPQAFTGVGRTLDGRVIQPTMVDLGSNFGPSEDPSQPPQNIQQNNSVASVTQSFDQFWSPNMDSPPSKWYHIFFLMCFPCFLGPICSPTRKRDYLRLVTSFIFWVSIVDIVYFIVELAVGGVVPWSKNTMIGPGSETLIRLGGKWVPLMKKNLELWRFITPMFMHSGFIHIIFNLLVQCSLGLAYEKQWGENRGKWGPIIGTVKMATIYFVSGFGSTLLSCLVLPAAVSVGASGAILGIIGAKAAYVICTWHKIPSQQKIAQGVSIVGIIMISFLFSFTGAVDWAGHLGGMFTGFLMGFIMFSSELETKWIELTCTIVSVCILMAYVFIGILVFALVL
jgi:membrane associated rhomboid family serine protease